MTPTTDALDQMVNVNFKMTERNRRAFKVWCTENGLTLTEGFHSGVTLLRATRDLMGQEPVETLLELMQSAWSFVIDKELDLRVERREDGTWTVCEGASLVTRDGRRVPKPMPQMRDEVFIARTRLSLAEAIRVARARARAEVRE
ncbi:hypothetical protein [Tabrizicola sp. BL-A-41-H6]|uniref:hypothetical protein n=1 Tax=Tabrizicola sp. BL-A-41-H6 TaxID=3421107 RepID=UPI003D6661D6